MPRRQTCVGREPVDALAGEGDRALARARSTPAIMLNSVVLPAPFGPMTAKIAPGATPKLTLSTASRPRKRLLTPLTSSSALMAAAPRHAELAGEPGPDAVRQHHHHHQQADAVEHLLGAGHVEAERGQQLLHDLGQAGQQECADDRAEQRADAADDRAEDQLDRARDVKDLLRKQIVVVEREEHAGDRGHAGGDDHRDTSCSGRC